MEIEDFLGLGERYSNNIISIKTEDEIRNYFLNLFAEHKICLNASLLDVVLTPICDNPEAASKELAKEIPDSSFVKVFYSGTIISLVLLEEELGVEFGKIHSGSYDNKMKEKDNKTLKDFPLVYYYCT